LRFERRDWKNEDDLESIIPKSCGVWVLQNFRYATSTVLVLPSKEESLGVVLLEAMATGTPVVASSVGGIPDIVEDGLNGFLVSYGDSQSLASSLIKLLSDDRLRERMGAKGKEMARNYVPHKIAMEHLNLYKRILHEAR